MTCPAPPPDNRSWYERSLDCVHCGLCLPQCPTYRLDRAEPDSPRGRLHLSRALAENRVNPSRDLFAPLDRCLDCRACEAVCPSGVGYHHILEGARERILDSVPLRRKDRLKLFFLDAVLTRPWVLRRAFDLLGIWEASGLRRLLHPLLPRALKRLINLLPPVPARADRRPPAPVLRPPGKVRGRVALFTGCVMTELFGRVHRDTVAVLLHHGFEVVTPVRQFCCGALSLHAGSRPRAQALATRNVQAFPSEVQAIIFDSAGCGAMLKDYGDLLAGTPMAEGAVDFAEKARDITEFLGEIGLEKPSGRVDLKVVYDDPCHLCNAQEIRRAPREMLRSIPGLVLVESADPERCCGAAGIYNIIQPEIAERLLAWKVKDLLATKAGAVATGNPGCLLQLRSGLGDRMAVVHPIELYARALMGGGSDTKQDAPKS